MSEKYRLEGGSKEYEKFINALKVAEAKAKEESNPVIIQRKLLNSYEDVAKVHPSGKREDIEGDQDI